MSTRMAAADDPSPSVSPSHPPRLEAVARAAGVSTMTASRALRGVGRVSLATRQRVLAAARSLGYARHAGLLLAGSRPAASADARWKVVLPVFRPRDGNVVGVFGARLVGALRDRLQEDGGELQVLEAVDLADLRRRWPRSKVHGIVLRTVLPTSWVRELARLAPVVSAISHDVHPGVDAVYFNEAKAATMIHQHLLERGHRHVAWATVDRSNPVANVPAEHYDPLDAGDRQAFQFLRARLGGWWTLDAGMRDDLCRHERIVLATAFHESTGEFDHRRAGRDLARAWLLLLRRPTAIVTASDEIAVALVEELAREGVSVPQDVGVVTYRVSQTAGGATESVTGVSLPFESVGQMIPEILQRRHANPEAPTLTLLLEPKLVDAGSVRQLSPPSAKRSGPPNGRRGC